jgi:hypothetical protein
MGFTAFAVMGLTAFAVRGFTAFAVMGFTAFAVMGFTAFAVMGLTAFAVRGLTAFRSPSGGSLRFGRRQGVLTHTPKQSGVTGLTGVRRRFATQTPKRITSGGV